MKKGRINADETAQKRSDQPATKQTINGYGKNRGKCLGMTQSSNNKQKHVHMYRQHRWQQTKHQTSKQMHMLRAKTLQYK